ncbi:hypothetical protein DUNSADRAFT_1380, partial [Dunaliella salina]
MPSCAWLSPTSTNFSVKEVLQMCTKRFIAGPLLYVADLQNKQTDVIDAVMRLATFYKHESWCRRSVSNVYKRTYCWAAALLRLSAEQADRCDRCRHAPGFLLQARIL